MNENILDSRFLTEEEEEKEVVQNTIDPSFLEASTEDDVLEFEKAKEEAILDSLPTKIDTIWGTIDLSDSPKTSAALVSAGYTMGDAYRGIRQILGEHGFDSVGYSEEELREQEQIASNINQFLDVDEIKWASMGGQAVGYTSDVVSGVLTGGGVLKAIPVVRNMKKYGTAAVAGGASGALGYADPYSNTTDEVNELLGSDLTTRELQASVGAVAGPVLIGLIDTAGKPFHHLINKYKEGKISKAEVEESLLTQRIKDSDTGAERPLTEAEASQTTEVLTDLVESSKKGELKTYDVADDVNTKLKDYIDSESLAHSNLQTEAQRLKALEAETKGVEAQKLAIDKIQQSTKELENVTNSYKANEEFYKQQDELIEQFKFDGTTEVAKAKQTLKELAEHSTRQLTDSEKALKNKIAKDLWEADEKLLLERQRKGRDFYGLNDPRPTVGVAQRIKADEEIQKFDQHLNNQKALEYYEKYPVETTEALVENALIKSVHRDTSSLLDVIEAGIKPTRKVSTADKEAISKLFKGVKPLTPKQRDGLTAKERAALTPEQRKQAETSFETLNKTQGQKYYEEARHTEQLRLLERDLLLEKAKTAREAADPAILKELEQYRLKKKLIESSNDFDINIDMVKTIQDPTIQQSIINAWYKHKQPYKIAAEVNKSAGKKVIAAEDVRKLMKPRRAPYRPVTSRMTNSGYITSELSMSLLGAGLGGTEGYKEAMRQEEADLLTISKYTLGYAALGFMGGHALMKSKDLGTQVLKNRRLEKSENFLQTVERQFSRYIATGESSDTAITSLLKSFPHLDKKILDAEAVTGRQVFIPQTIDDATVILNKYDRSGNKDFSLMGAGLNSAITPVSTTIKEASPKLWWKLMDYERKLKSRAEDYYLRIDESFKVLENLRHTDMSTINKMLQGENWEGVYKAVKREQGTEGVEAVKDIQKVLEELGEELKSKNLIKNMLPNYMPRYLRDSEGLMKYLSKEGHQKILTEIDEAKARFALKKKIQVTDISRDDLSTIINRIIIDNKKDSYRRSGHTQARSIAKLSGGMKKFYAEPKETLHSYIYKAVEDSETSSFFKGYVKEDPESKTVNLYEDLSFLNQLAKDNGIVKPHNIDKVTKALSARFSANTHSPNKYIANIRHMTNIGLLANLGSTIVQGADTVAAVYTQGLAPTVEAIARTLTGKTKWDATKAGLVASIAEEFADVSGGKWGRNLVEANKLAFKGTGFATLDKFGKNIHLNAALSRAEKLVTTEKGIEELRDEYGFSMGADFPQLVKDLKSKDYNSELVRSYAFAELSRIQPISRSEMPIQYLKHPNWRLAYQFKTFTLKQIDLLRRDAYNNIKKGNIEKGVSNLFGITAIMGAASFSANTARDVLFGRDVDSIEEVPKNILWSYVGNLGASEYLIDRAGSIEGKEDVVKLTAAALFPQTWMLDAAFGLHEGFTEEEWRDFYKSQGITKQFYYLFGDGASIDRWETYKGGYSDFSKEMKKLGAEW